MDLTLFLRTYITKSLLGITFLEKVKMEVTGRILLVSEFNGCVSERGVHLLILTDTLDMQLCVMNI